MTTTTAAKADVLDLGGTYVEKGQLVYVAAHGRDAAFSGPISAVDCKDGKPCTAQVHDGNKYRQVSVDRVSVEAPAKATTSKRTSNGKATARPSKILPRPEESNVTTATKAKPTSKRTPTKANAAKAKSPAAKPAPAKRASNGVVPLRPFPFAGIEWSITHGGVVTREGVQTGDHAWVNARTYMKTHLRDVVKMSPTKIDALVSEMAESVRVGKGGTFGPVKVRVRKS